MANTVTYEKSNEEHGVGTITVYGEPEKVRKALELAINLTAHDFAHFMMHLKAFTQPDRWP